MRILYLVVLLVLSKSAFGMGTAQDCARMFVDIERLACYDVLFQPKEDEKEEKELPIVWEYINHNGRDVLTIIGDENVLTRNGFERADLHIGCINDQISIYLDFFKRMDISGYGYQKVFYKVDDRVLKVMRMSLSRSQKMIGVWQSQSTKPVITDLIEGDELVIRAVQANHEISIATFDVRGLKKAIRPIANECGATS
ncbi:MAG: hypothetical protein ABJO86_05900 [Lentilitoribacter sp.]